MIYIFCALYQEAQFIIKEFQLKRTQRPFGQQVYEQENGNIMLVVTGVGMMKSAIAVSMACSYMNVGKDGFIINVGSCAGLQGGLYLCNKITEECTGRTFYPDMLYRSALAECEVVTVPRVIEAEGIAGINELGQVVVYDMEASAMYQAAIEFVDTDRIALLKVVSDGGNRIEIADLEMCMAKYGEDIISYIRTVEQQMTIQAQTRHNTGQVDETSMEQDVIRIGQDLCCSTTMMNELRQYIRYCTLTGIDYKALVAPWYESGELPCSCKKEGKIYLERFKKHVV